MSRPRDEQVFGPPICWGGWQMRLAGVGDQAAILRLRAQAFRQDVDADDSDPFDARSLHLWVGQAGQGPRATVRLAVHYSSADILGGYAAQVYDLRALAAATYPVIELGRLCSDPAGPAADADVLRMLWAGVARITLRSSAVRLIGCTSFPTTDPKTLEPALAVLASRFVGPGALRPPLKAPETYPLPQLAKPSDCPQIGVLPPLLRAYLALGGWVSDHVVIDRDLGTSHIFTCVDVAAMPAARKRVLTRMAEG